MPLRHAFSRRRKPSPTAVNHQSLSNRTTQQFIPAYQKAGYGWYDEYLMSDEWQTTKERITKKFPKSKYCWICDTKKNLNLHHENYNSIPHEDFLKGDVFWICQSHHINGVHILESGDRAPLLQEVLAARRKQLRKAYLSWYIRPTTIIPFILNWIYRLLW